MSETEASVLTVQTLSGEEHIVSRNMDKLLESGVIIDKYISMREFPRKVNGEWTKRTARLFPGYLFMETADPETLFLHLKRTPKLSKILADRENNFYRLKKDEILYINKIGAPRKDHTFGMSQVVIDNDNSLLKLGERVRVVSGNLVNFQGDIVRYDLHHRNVYLRTKMFGGTVIGVGIELVHKI